MDGNILLKARKILGLNQEVMAAKLGISYQTYNGYENGKTIPKTKHGKINEVLIEAKERQDNADSVLSIESTDILNEILKEMKAIRRENRDIKNLLNEVISNKETESKMDQLTSSQLDILKMVLQNMTVQLKELKKADLKSASTK
ncbi:helix-turn-helix transcriptional regulator [Chryseobacterium sp. NFX27]|uniref:helix-turn-helix transcriptional regulator n=1 Tax=Chryseobacterium sp. NFX27 TaxID=2819618 RepID=UPI003CE8CB41